LQPPFPPNWHVRECRDNIPKDSCLTCGFRPNILGPGPGVGESCDTGMQRFSVPATAKSTVIGRPPCLSDRRSRGDETLAR
jgi:hypothetical protein